MEQPKPDLVVAIDFGMTCTGVTYASLSTGSETVRWIQRWPGRMQATTWKPHPTVERFRSIIEQAGFGRSPNHKTSIGLTEAEAAAVFVSREAPAIFRERDILLVCDAGGGTTDLSVLRVTNTAGGTLSLEQLDSVFGATYGSARIDTAFGDTVQERLGMAERIAPLGIDINDASLHMMKSIEFQNAKCDYGSLDDTDFFSVAIPNLNKQYGIESLGIVSGEMRYKREDLQALFDQQENLTKNSKIVSLFELIDKQLHRIQQKFPHEQVAHLVLSGGLGNSLYVQKRLRTRFADSASSYSNASLVVCKGLLTDRLQKLKAGVSVLKWKCCRASYGVTHKVLCDPKNPLHFNLPTIVDTIDGKVYVENVVNWGQPLSTDSPITCTFRQHLVQGIEAYEYAVAL
ncbi:hypothetical protein LOCC1_G005487 [Lachnellula occidentalis]|uniref:Hsp70 family protein n=1 Tax=Lachnellula occidentalis TaxID=215460 RepID=A0A8H8RRS8_9HELO|nr:hypothetical protein LOCC1_G005487 [Lachnellula occidentalis]